MQITIDKTIEMLGDKTATPLSLKRYRIQNTECLTFPHNPGDDYYWDVIFSADGPQIYARLTNFSDKDVYYFWYWPFDRWDYESPEEQFKAFWYRLWTLITHKTKITQKNGFFWWRFVCYRWVDDKWVEVSTNSGRRKASVIVPPTEDRVREYFAGALTGNNT